MFPSKYFKRKEFACKCGTCGTCTVDAELLAVLDDLREFCGSAVVVNSGHRCEKYNKNVGGAPGSKHKQGLAADVRCAAVSTQKMYDYLCNKYPGKYGIGRYEKQGFVHVDVRPVGVWRRAA